MTWLLEPLSHAFMVKALLVSALVGGVCGLLSCYMTLKGWALMGDAVSHAVMPGVVCMPHGWGHASRRGVGWSHAASLPGESVNDITEDSRFDPLSGNAAVTAVPVDVRRA